MSVADIRCRTHKLFRALACLASGLGLLALVLAPARAEQPTKNERVSVGNDGTQGNSGSREPAFSHDGRYVAFSSMADNLVTDDCCNGRLTSEVFVHDRSTSTTTRVSVPKEGTEPNNSSFDPAVSDNGRYIAFYSYASNLVDGDTNDVYDVFVRDVQTAITSRVSVASAGLEADGASALPDISRDGRYITFSSAASNLVAGDTNRVLDVFVHDRKTVTTTRVSVASDGTQGNYYSWDPEISGDGRYITFISWASNLVAGDTPRWDIFVHDRQTGTTTRVSEASDATEADGASEEPEISDDGRYITYSSYASNLVAGDTNYRPDIFVHDRQTGTTTRVSVASDGTQADYPSDAHHSFASEDPEISGDGRFITFYSDAANLVAGDTNGVSDIFVHDRQTAITARMSVGSDGTQTSRYSYHPAISGDGQYVAFKTYAFNLVAEDTNGYDDVFVRGIQPDDLDGDGDEASADNCGSDWNADQNDLDGDGQGDACDEDIDGDGKSQEAGADNCPLVANAVQIDGDADGKGDACDRFVTKLFRTERKVGRITGVATFTHDDSRLLKIKVEGLRMRPGRLLRVNLLEQQLNHALLGSQPIKVGNGGTAKLRWSETLPNSLSAGDVVVVTRGNDGQPDSSRPYFDDALLLGRFKVSP